MTGYPPPVQVAGVLLNAIFLDLLDEDSLRLSRINELLAGMEPEARQGMRPIRLLTIRPSVDLGRLAGKFEPQLPRAIRYMTRGLGTKHTETPDFLSLIMFQTDYLSELMRVGEADRKRGETIWPELLEPGTPRRARPAAPEDLKMPTNRGGHSEDERRKTTRAG